MKEEDKLMVDFEIMRIKLNLLSLILRDSKHDNLREELVKFINSDLAPLTDE